MSRQSKGAQTFAEWWQPEYAWEHRLLGVLAGFLFAALISLSGTILSRARLPDATPTITQEIGSLEAR